MNPSEYCRIGADRLDGASHRASGILTLAGHTQEQTPPGMHKRPLKEKRKKQPENKQGIYFKPRSKSGIVAPEAKSNSGQHAAARLDERFAEIKGQPYAQEKKRNTDRNVVHAWQIANQGVDKAEQRPREAGGKNAQPWRSCQVRGRKRAHRPKDECSLQTKIGTAAFLSDGFADTDEKVRRRYAYGPRKNCE